MGNLTKKLFNDVTYEVVVAEIEIHKITGRVYLYTWFNYLRLKLKSHETAYTGKACQEQLGQRIIKGCRQAFE